MWCTCKYNSYRDLGEVSDYGYVDLVKANQTSKIDAPIALIDTQYNEIDDPRAVGLRPSDNFDAIQLSKVVLDYKPKDSSAKEVSSD